MNNPSVNEQAEQLPSHVQFLTTAAGVQGLIEHLATHSVIAIDTEFMREDTYFPLLALIQIGLPEQIYLVDPVAVNDAAVLRALVQAMPLSVLHAPGEDYGVLLHAAGVVPEHTLDTQIGAAFAGLTPGLGLRELLRQVVDITLDKDQTRSNWLKRPLSNQQLHYAADDVRHLLDLHRRLVERIVARGQFDWFVDECRRLRCIGASNEADTQPHWNFRRADELPEPAQRRLYQLLHWRERRARDTDRPRNWIAPQALLLALAERSVTQVSEIETLMTGLQIQGGRRRAEALLAALQLNDPELDKAFIAAPPQFSGAQKRRYSVLREAVEKRAAELLLPMELLAPRRLLEPWLRDGHMPIAWQGWRCSALAGVMESVAELA